MSTERNYAPRNSYATENPPEAQNQAQTPPTADHRQSPTSPQTWFDYLLDQLEKSKAITVEERPLVWVLDTTDDSMAPQLVAGGKVAAVEVEEYSTAKGVVAVGTRNSSDYLFGRIESVTDRFINLTRDNPAFPPLTLSQSSIVEMYHVRFMVNMPVY